MVVAPQKNLKCIGALLAPLNISVGAYLPRPHAGILAMSICHFFYVSINMCFLALAVKVMGLLPYRLLPEILENYEHKWRNNILFRDFLFCPTVVQQFAFAKRVPSPLLD